MLLPHIERRRNHTQVANEGVQGQPKRLESIPEIGGLEGRCVI
jgi:hypothetical protein